MRRLVSAPLAECYLRAAASAAASTNMNFELQPISDSTTTKTIPMTVWSPQQHAYRNVLRSLRNAHYNDRARLFWARHFARVEFYKYGAFVGEGDVRYKAKQEQLLNDLLKREDSVDMGDLLGMDATMSEATAATEKTSEEQNKAASNTSFDNLAISTSSAVGHMNEAELITYSYRREQSSPSPQHQHLVNLANECADFIHKYLRVSVDRIVEHNDVMMSLSVSDAKKFRKAYLLREEQHESWCKQKIRQILDRRPVAPFPYC